MVAQIAGGLADALDIALRLDEPWAFTMVVPPFARSTPPEGFSRFARAAYQQREQLKKTGFSAAFPWQHSASNTAVARSSVTWTRKRLVCPCTMHLSVAQRDKSFIALLPEYERLVAHPT